MAAGSIHTRCAEFEAAKLTNNWEMGMGQNARNPLHNSWDVWMFIQPKYGIS
jgi:hypothetical protein